MSLPASSSVFVGNVAYETTEEELMALMHEAGPVVSLRLVFDQDTGKPKGFGFCEFADEPTATAAIRNLNGREIKGRVLRVDYADVGAGAAVGGHKRKAEDAEAALEPPPAKVPRLEDQDDDNAPVTRREFNLLLAQLRAKNVIDDE